MIGRLRGRVWDRTASQVVVDVQGVGYEVTVSAHTGAQLGETVELFVYTHVREDVLQLFGFATLTERRLFDLLLTVPNVGPVKAMQVLQSPVESFVDAVASRDVQRLAKLPGVGKKTAERILVDLADKVTAVAGAASSSAPAAPRAEDGLREDLVSALLHLGFRDNQAEEAAEVALARGRGSLQDLVRRALGHLSDRRGKDAP